MKIRDGFISNSSSSSFIVWKFERTKKQKESIYRLREEDFHIDETERFIVGHTIMDNIGIKNYFSKLGIPEYQYYINTNFGWIYEEFLKEAVGDPDIIAPNTITTWDEDTNDLLGNV